ncbi:serine/threonine-protein phosphatase 1 regulatory subunit 10 isoform X1 [Halyomorpha halys]|uniref:serine/threonine-protein phosphatase 1 regulatory subunit 10 isoform X1 n=2 Tax=Halyomorpha halys TaxID=286706 RepID=UPI0006D4C754|nr:serine/threonine-protein phosphatase 1 regulatory subunit 10-like isoform X1 [Halyomorpha halys]
MVGSIEEHQPRIDPNQLLKCLSVLLSPNGGIKSKDEVQRLESLMTKFSKKLVSKCIYVLILKSTESDLLDMFMSAGGWDLTFNWLSDGIQCRNWPLVAELVELLLLCPVDIERLKGNNCPKLIKVLSKDPSATDRVRNLACSVVDKWLAIVKGACEASGAPSVAGGSVESGNPPVVENGDAAPEEISPRGLYKITIRDGKNVLAEVITSERSGTRIEEGVEGSDEVNDDSKSSTETRPVLKLVNEDPVAKESLPPKKLAEGKKTALKRKSDKKNSPEPEKKVVSKEKKKVTPEKKAKFDPKAKSKDKKIAEKSNSNKSSSEKHGKEKTPEEKSQEEKDKINIMKLITPSIGNLGKIPKKSKDDKKAPPAEPNKPLPKDPKKYNISIETRKGGEERPKTVKTFNSKFRSTGLEELPPLPKNPKKKEDIPEKKAVKRPSPVKEVHLPEKKIKEEDKTEKQAATPPKPKISGLQESDVFADALTAANPVKDIKKRKRRSSTSSSPSDAKKECNAIPKTEDKEGKEAIKPVLKFYQDTLITSEEIKMEKADSSEEKPSTQEKVDLENEKNESDITETLTKEELEDEVAKAEEAIDQVLKLEEKKNVEREKNRLPKGVLVYVKKYKTIKKNVKWKCDKELESIQYFELDETERVNVTKPFMDMKQNERINERIMLSRKLVSEDIMEEKTPWRPLIPIDVVGDLVIPGKNSIEKETQRARERTTLQEIYFNRSLIPDSPAEPDLEIHAYTEPAIIPLKDQTGNMDSVISYKDKPWPEPKGYPPGTVGSPPQMIIDSPNELAQPSQPGIPSNNMFPQQFPPQAAMQPYMPPSLMQHDWMGSVEGGNMMVGGGQGNEPMMMPGMPPGMHPGLLPTPDMFHMGPHPHPPEFMPPPFGPMGPPPPGMFPGNFPPNVHHQEQNQRHHRPWFRGQNNGGSGGSGSGGTWRHPSKGGGGWTQNKMCKYYLKKGHCRQSNCNFRHGSGKGNVR